MKHAGDTHGWAIDLGIQKRRVARAKHRKIAHAGKYETLQEARLAAALRYLFNSEKSPLGKHGVISER